MRGIASVVATTALAVSGVVGLGASASADVAAPVVFPADGSAITTTSTVFTATYDVIAGEASSLAVIDATSRAQVPCDDGVTRGSTPNILRCAVRDLVPGHRIAVTASMYDDATHVTRTDGWSVTVDAPAVVSSWPQDGALLTDSADDPPPGSARPVTVTFDRPLAAGTSARLFRADSGVRSAVDAEVTVDASTVSVAPASDLPAGEYALVADPVDADGGEAPVTLEFGVGTDALPDRPAYWPVTYDSYRLPNWINGVGLVAPGGGATAGIVVYDPAHPDVRRTSDFSVVACDTKPWCLMGWLPTADLPAGTYAWYADVHVGALTRSTPDHVVVVPGARPAAPTDLELRLPQSTTDYPGIHISGSAPGATAVRISVSEYLAQHAVVAVEDGRFDAVVPSAGFSDGLISAEVGAVDSVGGVSPTLASVAVTREVVPLAVAVPPTSPTGPDAGVRVRFNEGIRGDWTMSVTDAHGSAVAGWTSSYATGELDFAASATLSSQTYRVHVHAYAQTCPADQTTSCEQVTADYPWTVDATPDRATTVTVVPRVASPPNVRVVVSGHGVPGDAVTVAIGAATWHGAVGPPPATGQPGAFTSDPIDVSRVPHALLPVSVTTVDAFGNRAVVPAGTVDHRWPVSVPVSLSRTSLPWGQTVTVTGHVSRQTVGTAAAPATVTLVQRLDSGAVGWISSSTVTPTGTFSVTGPLVHSGTLQVRYAGSTADRPGSSAWSARVAVAARTTPTDHAGTLAAARTQSAWPPSTVLSETLRTGSDIDVIPVAAGSSGVYQLRLGHLPVNATLRLYDWYGHILATSARSGLQYEEIIRSLPSGTYFVGISSPSGAASPVPYHLVFRRLPYPVSILSSYGSFANGGFKTLELLNTTSGWRDGGVWLQCVAGSRVLKQTEWVGLIVAPHGRTNFLVSTFFAGLGACPTGSSLRFLPSTALMDTPPPTGGAFRVVHHPSYLVAGGGRVYPLTVTNTGTTTLRGLWTCVSEYNAEGGLRDGECVYQDPLAPGASRTVSSLSAWSGTTLPANRTVFDNRFFA